MEHLAAAEDMKEAAVGAGSEETPPAKSTAGQGFEPETIAAFFRRNADALEKAALPQSSGISVHSVAQTSAATLRNLAQDVETRKSNAKLEDLERHLTVLEEKLFAALLTAAPDDEPPGTRSRSAGLRGVPK